MTAMHRIRDVLAPLGIPVAAYIGDSTKPVYAVMHDLLEQGEQYADDTETATGNYIQIDFIAKTNIEGLVKKATNLLVDAGFTRRNRRTEYETETKTYRHMLRVLYYSNNEEENDDG